MSERAALNGGARRQNKGERRILAPRTKVIARREIIIKVATCFGWAARPVESTITVNTKDCKYEFALGSSSLALAPFPEYSAAKYALSSSSPARPVVINSDGQGHLGHLAQALRRRGRLRGGPITTTTARGRSRTCRDRMTS